MNCITHQGREAVGVCRECGNPICRECYDEFGGYCMHCAQKESKEIKKMVVKTLILAGIGILVAIIALVVSIQEGSYYSSSFLGNLLFFLASLVLYGCIPFGWLALNRITSQMFLFLPLVGWVIYFLIKLTLAMLIGWIVAIPKIIALNKSLRYALAVDKSIKEMRGYSA